MEMFARRNVDGVSVNESAVCSSCRYDSDALDASYDLWQNAEDVMPGLDFSFHLADNPDARCVGCGVQAQEDN